MKPFPSVILALAFIAVAFLAYALLVSNPDGEPIKTEAYFCPSDNCFSLIASLISNSTKADCAFYALSSSEIENALKSVEARIVVDEKCPSGIECRARQSRERQYSKSPRRGLMHNKFCILDDSIVITGSFNPNEKTKNYQNNVVALHSKPIAKEYADEFEELWEGYFGGGARGKQKNVVFCPEDDCKDALIKELKKARKSIYFMVYSFTDKDIAEVLAELHNNNVIVRGFFDKSQNSRWSVYDYLKEKGIDVALYEGGVLHHKVFIVDNETVITGSYNPTQNGNEYNDENMVILHDKILAQEFAEHFP